MLEKLFFCTKLLVKQLCTNAWSHVPVMMAYTYYIGLSARKKVCLTLIHALLSFATFDNILLGKLFFSTQTLTSWVEQNEHNYMLVILVYRNHRCLSAQKCGFLTLFDFVYHLSYFYNIMLGQLFIWTQLLQIYITHN